MKNKTAKAADFKPGVVLVDEKGIEYTILRKYDNGIWEARCDGGEKCVFENEARFYSVKQN